jgi:hypothetical protein
MHSNRNRRGDGYICRLLTVGNYDGTQVIHLPDWLTEKNKSALPEF